MSLRWDEKWHIESRMPLAWTMHKEGKCVPIIHECSNWMATAVTNKTKVHKHNKCCSSLGTTCVKIQHLN